VGLFSESMTDDAPVLAAAELYIYPLKSARGIPVPALEFDARGPIGDRRWMLIDEQTEFLSQRRIPRMSLLRVALQSDGLVVDAPGMPTLVVPPPANDDPSERLVAGLFEDRVTVRRVGNDVDRWFTTFLRLPCSLVTMPDDTQRVVDPTYAPRPRIVAFADAFPVLLVGAASIDELNRRLVAKGLSRVGVDRFRPNVVVSGGAPHEEDTWRQLTGCHVALDIVKPCARCAIVTVDQARGIRGKEPLKTLAEYRKRGETVLFGQNALHDGPGRIVRGERLRALKRP
jgi:uncharacterized protein